MGDSWPTMQSEKWDVLVISATTDDAIPDTVLAYYGNKAFLLA